MKHRGGKSKKISKILVFPNSITTNKIFIKIFLLINKLGQLEKYDTFKLYFKFLILFDNYIIFKIINNYEIF